MIVTKLTCLFVVSCVLSGMLAFDVRRGSAQSLRLDEHHVKAAFLYNFAKFIQWPAADQAGALTVGVVGRSGFNEALEAIVIGKKVGGRDVLVRELLNEDDVRAFQIIFIPALEARRTAEIIRRVGVSSVLTVGETPHFLQDGGLVSFYVRDKRVRFRIDSAAALRADLKVSSQLLTLGKQ